MSIVLEQLTKRYEGHPVVNQVSLEIANGELFVLLGPSGSGKSTVLRMIAGLTGIDQGRVLLHGRDVTEMLPQQRDTGFVFQNYALFRHMSVGDNVEFALRIRKASAVERRQRRDTLLELVGLAGLGKRMPHQLSGGQQQRVALARALAHSPAVLLLDEPFGALDAKIRIELRRTLKEVQREIGMTTIFVTHDQEEAFELADRMGVMNAGRLLEVGPPEELYQRPQTEFVATFLGMANLLVGQCTADGVHLGDLHFPLATEAAQMGDAQRVQVLFRPEDVALAPAATDLQDPPLGQAEVEQTTFVGSVERLRLRLPALPGVQAIAPAVPFGSDSILIDAMRSQDQARRFPLRMGDRPWLGIHALHALTHPGLRLLILSNDSPTGQAALALGGQLARLAHARTTILGYGLRGEALAQHLHKGKEQIGSGLPVLETLAANEPLERAIAHEVERQPTNLVIAGAPVEGRVELAEQCLQAGEHHLLLVPSAQPTPTRILICVSSGEPGKEDVRFTGRLARHLGAEVTLMSVITDTRNPDQAKQRAERFLEAGVRTLGLLGVQAHTLVRSGAVRDTITAEMASGNHDLLVLGAPLSEGNDTTVVGVVEQLVRGTTTYPILIVRSRYATAGAPWIAANGRVSLAEEVIR
ncbi:MAG: ATP-binding cassette domain-containing protein [Herpetosiphonaceae bacterium]|nr:ATP-binding cassette domain-containing protein [Herpetosiphonaceae bacterium]